MNTSKLIVAIDQENFTAEYRRHVEAADTDSNGSLWHYLVANEAGELSRWTETNQNTTYSDMVVIDRRRAAGGDAVPAQEYFVVADFDEIDEQAEAKLEDLKRDALMRTLA